MLGSKYRFGAVAFALSASACNSESSNTSDKDAGTPAVSEEDDAGPGDAGEETYASPLTVSVDAGGPYRVAAGDTLKLTASYAVEGQLDETADLSAIGAALVAYEAEHRSFPPAALSDASGNSLLSWRVLLLPYLGEQELYARFDLTKAWDDPANEALVSEIPAAFRDGDGDGSGNTHYAGVAGKKQVFSGSAPELGGGIPKVAITDGVDMTFAVGPVGRDVSLPWTAPGDIAIAEHLGLGKADGFGGSGGAATPMAFLDGHVYTFPNDVETLALRRWSTLGGDGCDRAGSADVNLRPQWDLDGDGTFETSGSTVDVSPSDTGELTLGFRVVDRFGGVHATTAKVVVE
jgi:Protein of unknown function (DUF1559)